MKKKSSRKIIFCFSDYYLPGYKAGGPIKSISNFVEEFGEEYEIKIFTRNHDFGEYYTYKNIINDNWNKIGKALVYFSSEKNLNLNSLKKILNTTPYDLLYLNSFFSFKFTILPILISKLNNKLNKPCIVAPRGEFSDNALKLKKFQKILYIQIFNYLKFYQNLNFQASSNLEKHDILKKIPKLNNNIYIASDIFISNNINNLKNYKSRKPGPLRLIFLSRISPMKNLKFLLEVLTKINTKIEFSIYGPKSDSKYWQECFVIIQRLSSNIKIDIHGEILHKEVLSIFKKYDLFVFPTLGENFGHVIFESLQAGTPVLVSDKTPWLDNNMGGLHLISLDQDKWVKIITKWSELDGQKLLQKRKETVEYMINLNQNNKSLKQNKILFNSVLNENINV